MKQKSFDAVRQKSRALAVLLCLAVLLLTGCGGGGAAAPEPPASAPAAGRTDEDTASSPAAPAPSEPESVSSSTAASESEAQSPQEPEVEDFLRCEPMDYTSVSAVCSGQEGTLIVVKVRVENTTEQVVHAFNTSASLGNVTVDNAVDGMSVDRVAAGKAAEHLTVVLRTTQETVVKKPVVAALESAAEALQPGQSTVAYGYVFLPASEGSWTRADFLWKEQAIGSLTPKKKPQAPAESAAPSDSTAASAPSAKPEPPASSERPTASERPAVSESPAASPPTASPGSPAGSEPSSQPEMSAGSEHPAASEAPASPPASSAPSAPETPAGDACFVGSAGAGYVHGVPGVYRAGADPDAVRFLCALPGEEPHKGDAGPGKYRRTVYGCCGWDIPGRPALPERHEEPLDRFALLSDERSADGRISLLRRHVGPEHRAEAGGLGGDLGLRAPVGYGEGVSGRRVALCLLRRQNVPHPGRRCPVSGAGTKRLEAWDEQQKILKNPKSRNFSPGGGLPSGVFVPIPKTSGKFLSKRTAGVDEAGTILYTNEALEQFSYHRICGRAAWPGKMRKIREAVRIRQRRSTK